jgi:hypothetical protein
MAGGGVTGSTLTTGPFSPLRPSCLAVVTGLSLPPFGSFGLLLPCFMPLSAGEKGFSSVGAAFGGFAGLLALGLRLPGGTYFSADGALRADLGFLWLFASGGAASEGSDL